MLLVVTWWEMQEMSGMYQQQQDRTKISICVRQLCPDPDIQVTSVQISSTSVNKLWSAWMLTTTIDRWCWCLCTARIWRCVPG